MPEKFTPITGAGKYPRAVRELQQAVARQQPGTVPGALVSTTPRGTLSIPDPLAPGARPARRSTGRNVWV